MKQKSIMLVIAMLTITMLFTSCDLIDGIFKKKDTTISPPAWLYGTWKGSWESKDHTFKVTHDDIDTPKIGSVKEILQTYNISPTETKSDTRYTISINVSDKDYTYTIVKITDTTVEITEVLGTTKTGPYLLTKITDQK